MTDTTLFLDLAGAEPPVQHTMTVPTDLSANQLQRVLSPLFELVEATWQFTVEPGGTTVEDIGEALSSPGATFYLEQGEVRISVAVQGEMGFFDVLAQGYPRLAPIIQAADLGRYTELSDEMRALIDEELAATCDPVLTELAAGPLDYPKVPIGSALQTVPLERGFVADGEPERAASSLVKLITDMRLARFDTDALYLTERGEDCLENSSEYLRWVDRNFPYAFNSTHQIEAVVSALFALVGQSQVAGYLGVAAADFDNAYSQVIHDMTGGHVTPTSSLNKDLRGLLGLEKQNALSGALQPTEVGKHLIGWLLNQL
ncbi:hypothetical protein [Corynebacterium cystitidis]|uniref:Uncharacterized protein n=1 Tax=Corynebacterium cystitidis DSM 20524 TaxID=1121357 RepID=A0A1H9UX75_9CORY|nr:hypothetical protein [Corynebacterium cystitidis]WJY83653.1 hypothetical protein CCYS_13860 [Corynebacterium cystitidis DSM 20524]SES14150.1 hypothetical protein SAMN05661109_01983 [Corynebacterium cystitidis DSM 20524]SNV91509.1 Uncharacterised protein [Corynebacterium cystitidis]